ncbi:MAG TPA: response regulator transcription factor [Chloroflexota bacterium]|nr:response regulator transcription factor [Chloroflexota bacterium]
MAIRIVIADDHAVVRRGLRTLLELDPEIEVIAEAADGREAIELAHRLEPDVVVMDLFMPGTDGVTATQLIRQDLPKTEVVALTSVLEGTSVTNAVQAGAIAYLLKDTRSDNLCQAIRAAAAGQVQLAPNLVERLLRELPLPRHMPLESIEQTMLIMLAEGCTNAQLAAQLDVDESEARACIDRLLRKLQLRSRTQAALYAQQVGLLTG